MTNERRQQIEELIARVETWNLKNQSREFEALVGAARDLLTEVDRLIERLDGPFDR